MAEIQLVASASSSYYPDTLLVIHGPFQQAPLVLTPEWWVSRLERKWNKNISGFFPQVTQRWILRQAPQCVCVCIVAQSCPTLCDPMDYSPTGSSVHGILQARILEWVAIPFWPGDLPNPGTKLESSALQADSLPAEPPGKPKPLGAGGLLGGDPRVWSSETERKPVTRPWVRQLWAQQRLG